MKERGSNVYNSHKKAVDTTGTIGHTDPMERMIVYVDDALKRLVIEWQHQHQMPSRTEAVRAILRAAVEPAEKEEGK